MSTALHSYCRAVRSSNDLNRRSHLDATVPCNFSHWSARPIVQGHPSICWREMDLSAGVSMAIVRNKPCGFVTYERSSQFSTR